MVFNNTNISDFIEPLTKNNVFWLILAIATLVGGFGYIYDKLQQRKKPDVISKISSDVLKIKNIQQALNEKMHSNTKSLEDIDIPSISKQINIDYDKTVFIKLKKDAPKSPLELIKENPKDDTKDDNILPFLGIITKFEIMGEQIKYVENGNWVGLYPNTWAEREAQLIGLHILKEIKPKIQKFTDMYDAGCAYFGQYKALMALKEEDGKFFDEKLRYFAQDFIPEWEDKLKIKSGTFFENPLPLVSFNNNQKITLVSCTQTFHFMEGYPLSIYASLYSFNKLLEKDGYCYITVPEKENQPGMLDLLEKSAIDAGFIKVDSGKYRLIHTLKKEPLNVTTFLYLIVQKRDKINDKDWVNLIKASLFRAGYRGKKEYIINGEYQITDEILDIEKYIKYIFKEKNTNLRTFRYALDVIKNDRKVKCPDDKKCRKNIKKLIKEIHELIIDIKENENNKEINFEKLQSKCALYFYYLVAFYVSTENNLNDIYGKVKTFIVESKDSRVKIDDLTPEQVARLLRHFFELCRYENIDIREVFDNLDFSKDSST